MMTMTSHNQPSCHNSNPSLRTLAFLAAALVSALTTARAADYTWDANGTTAGITDGGGSWSTALGRWDPDGSGTAAVSWPNGSGENNAIIGNGGTAGIITISSGQVINVSNITFNAVSSGSYSLSPGASATTKLVFSPNAVVRVAAGVIATNRVSLQGTAFTKEGDGAFQLNPSTSLSEYSGAIIVNAGTLIVNSGTAGRFAIGAGGLKVNAGGTASIGVGGSSNEQINDTASITNAGGVIDWNVNDIFGSLVLESGLFTNSYGGGGRTLTATGPIFVQSGTIAGNSSRNFQLAGGVDLIKSSGGTVTLGPFFTGFWTNTTAINAGKLALVGNATIPNTTNISVASGATLDVFGLSGTFTVGAAQTLAGNGTVTGSVALATSALIKPGTNTLKLTFLGNLTVNSNTVVIDAGGATLPVGLYRVIDYSGTKSGFFNPTPIIINGSTAATPVIDDSNPGTVDLIVGNPCIPANIGTQPTDQTAFAGGKATFSLTASGSSRTYQWQISTDSGSTFNDVSTGSGGTTASYQTDFLSLGDSTHKFRCIVSVACDGSSKTSSVVTLTVVSAPMFRSAGSGTWEVNGTWEQSFNSGGSWVGATNTPTADNSTSIVVQGGHSVTNTVAIPGGVDDLTIQTNALVVVSGVPFTIANGAATVDCDVSGTLELDNAVGGSVTATGALQFGGSGKFIWARAAIIAMPTATWLPGSVCEIQNAAAGTPSGLGQSFYHFNWNWPTENTAVSLAGNLTNVSGNLTVSASANAANSLRFLASEQTNTITVGGDVLVNSGYLTMSGGSQSNTVENLNIAGKLVIAPGAFLDNRSSGSNCVGNIIFNGSGQQYFTNAGTITHSSGSAALAFKVNSGASVNLVGGNLTISTIPFGWVDTVTVDGTLNLGTNQITGTGALSVSAGGTLVGHGTNQLTTGLSSVSYGGTLNIQSGLPSFTGGEFFTLFGASGYSGTFSSIVPATPGAGLTWVTSALTSSGTLAVSSGGGGGGTTLAITNTILSGTTLTLYGKGGTNGGPFTVFTSTDLTTALGSWSSWGTGTFDGSGRFAVTNSIVPANVQSFYIIHQP